MSLCDLFTCRICFEKIINGKQLPTEIYDLYSKYEGPFADIFKRNLSIKQVWYSMLLIFHKHFIKNKGRNRYKIKIIRFSDWQHYCIWYKIVMWKLGTIPGSSSGRTEDSGSSNGGSNPSPGIFIFLRICDESNSKLYPVSLYKYKYIF